MGQAEVLGLPFHLQHRKGQRNHRQPVAGIDLLLAVGPGKNHAVHHQNGGQQKHHRVLLKAQFPVAHKQANQTDGHRSRQHNAERSQHAADAEQRNGGSLAADLEHAAVQRVAEQTEKIQPGIRQLFKAHLKPGALLLRRKMVVPCQDSGIDQIPRAGGRQHQQRSPRQPQFAAHGGPGEAGVPGAEPEQYQRGEDQRQIQVHDESHSVESRRPAYSRQQRSGSQRAGQRFGPDKAQDQTQAEQQQNHVGQIKAPEDPVEQVPEPKGAHERRRAPRAAAAQSDAPGKEKIAARQRRQQHRLGQYPGQMPVVRENHQSHLEQQLFTEHPQLGGIIPVGGKDSALPVELAGQDHLGGHVAVQTGPAPEGRKGHRPQPCRHQPDPG